MRGVAEQISALAAQKGPTDSSQSGFKFLDLVRAAPSFLYFQP